MDLIGLRQNSILISALTAMLLLPTGLVAVCCRNSSCVYNSNPTGIHQFVDRASIGHAFSPRIALPNSRYLHPTNFPAHAVKPLRCFEISGSLNIVSGIKMGVHSLWALLNECVEQCSLRQFAGQTLCIDLSLWLSQALLLHRSQGGVRGLFAEVAPHMRVIFHRAVNMLSLGINLIAVTDGVRASRAVWAVISFGTLYIIMLLR